MLSGQEVHTENSPDAVVELERLEGAIKEITFNAALAACPVLQQEVVMARSAVAVLRALPFRERVCALVQTIGRPWFFLPDMAVERKDVIARVTAGI